VSDALDLLPPAKAKPTRKAKSGRTKSNLTFAASFDTTFAAHFDPLESFAAWRACGAAVFGEPMTEDELALFQVCTGRMTPPTTPFREAYIIVGRRGGKSWMMSAAAVYAACVRETPLKPGELGVVMLMATDKDQAAEIFRYVKSIVESEFAGLVEGRIGKEHIDLTNGLRIRVQVANFRRVRGRKVVMVICDEIAFWWNDETSANPDREILRAVRPAMLGVPNAALLCISSPYAQRGALWDAYKRFYGKDDAKTLVWKAPTWVMFPGVDREFLAEEEANDPVAYASEYGGEFRADLASFIGPDTWDAMVVAGRRRLPREPGLRYIAYTDTAGGAGKDSATLAIVAVMPDKSLALACLSEWRPRFSPIAVAEELAGLLKEYGVSIVTGDRFSGDVWPDLLRKHGITYRVSERNTSEVYAAALPILSSTGRVAMLEHDRLRNQALALVRRTGPSGRDSITHPPGGNDDLCTSVLGALVEAHIVSARPSEAVTEAAILRPSVQAIMESRAWEAAEAHRHDPRYAAVDTGMDKRGMSPSRYQKWRAAWGGTS
jgi:hypothetical protein